MVAYTMIFELVCCVEVSYDLSSFFSAYLTAYKVVVWNFEEYNQL